MINTWLFYQMAVGISTRKGSEERNARHHTQENIPISKDQCTDMFRGRHLSRFLSRKTIVSRNMHIADFRGTINSASRRNSGSEELEYMKNTIIGTTRTYREERMAFLGIELGPEEHFRGRNHLSGISAFHGGVICATLRHDQLR